MTINFSALPEDVLRLIEFHAIMLVYREKHGNVLDEMAFKKNTVGCVFLNLTNYIPELEYIEYGGGFVERIPPLEKIN